MLLKDLKFSKESQLTQTYLGMFPNNLPRRYNCGALLNSPEESLN